MRDLLVVGGIPVKDQIAALNAGIDIVCGTPGRMEELINTGQLSLQSCKFFVLDEADGLLKQVMSLVLVTVWMLFIYAVGPQVTILIHSRKTIVR